MCMTPTVQCLLLACHRSVLHWTFIHNLGSIVLLALMCYTMARLSAWMQGRQAYLLVYISGTHAAAAATVSI